MDVVSSIEADCLEEVSQADLLGGEVAFIPVVVRANMTR
jgi:hypothetical protein